MKIRLRFAFTVFLAACSLLASAHTGLASPSSRESTLILSPKADPLLPNSNIWRQINNGLPVPGYNHAHSLVTDPQDAAIIYGGFSYDYGMSHGVFKTTDGGEHWLPADTGLPASPNIMALVMDPTDREILYAINGQVGLYKSIDQARHWTKVTSLPEDVRCVAVAGEVIYVGGYSTIYLSTDGGDTFNPTFSYPGLGTMNAFWIDPGNSAHVIAAYGSSVAQTTDSGHQWTNFTLTGCDTAYTTSVAVDPTNEDNIIVGTWFCLLRSTNGGSTWANVHTIGHVNFIRFDPLDHNRVYASSDNLGPSVFIASLDAGATWNNFDSGFPSAYQVAAMALGPSNQAALVTAQYMPGCQGGAFIRRTHSFFREE